THTHTHTHTHTDLHTHTHTHKHTHTHTHTYTHTHTHRHIHTHTHLVWKEQQRAGMHLENIGVVGFIKVLCVKCLCVMQRLTEAHRFYAGKSLTHTHTSASSH